MNKPVLVILPFLFLCNSEINAQYVIESAPNLNPDLITVVVLTRKVVLEEQVQGNSSNNVDLSHLNSGIYFVVLQQNYGLKSIKKVIKQ
jgi:hypothetical protein